MKSKGRINRVYFDRINTLNLLAYIAWGVWHLADAEVVFWSGLALAFLSFVLILVSLCRVGRLFRILEPASHRYSIVMTVLINVIYLANILLA